MSTYRNDMGYPIDVPKYGAFDIEPGKTFPVPDGESPVFETGISLVEDDGGGEEPVAQE